MAAVGQEVEQAIRSLPDVADTLLQFAEVALFADDPAVLEGQPHQEARPQGANEEAALPAGEGRACVEGHARGRDHRIPIVDWLLHA